MSRVPRPMALKESGNQPARSMLKPPTSFLPRPGVSQVKRKADAVEEPSAKRARPALIAAKPAAPVTSRLKATTARAPAQRNGINTKAASKPAPSTTRPAAGRLATRPAAGAVKPSVNGTRSSVAPLKSRPGALAAKPVARPAADIKRLEEDNADLQQQIESLERNKKNADSEIDTLEASLRKQKRLLEETEEDYDRQLKKERAIREDLEDSDRQMKRKVSRLEEEIEEKRTAIAGLKDNIHHLEQQLSSMRGEVSDLTGRIEDMMMKLREKEATISLLQSTVKDRDATISDLEANIVNFKATIAELEQKVREGERQRKVLHNTVLELKGNIRVFCRVRPLLGEELDGVPGDDPNPQHIMFGLDGKSLELDKLAENNCNESMLSQTIRGPSGKGKYAFHFDQVFAPDSTQSVVFEEISQLVQSALDGYQVAVFAYGQTGSGKTFTMEGASDEQRGMIPRAVEQVFLTAEKLTADGWKYELQVSFLEIYNEKIRDLLGNQKDDIKHELKRVSSNSNEVSVSNLTIVQVNSAAQVNNLIKKATQNRAVAETKMNEHSSRSHSVFRLHIQGFNSHTQEKLAGCLNMIDLAGSERLKESKSEGDRLKETKNINSSLAHLGNVILALSKKDPHVPFRNSKLTHLLSNSLGGSSKVLMFLNISPREECFSETLNSLRFATKVNNCNIGTAQKKVK